MHQWWFGLLILSLSFAVQGMKIEVQGDSIYASGSVEDDYLKFQEALLRPGIKRVVLANSPGGDYWTGLKIGQMIREHGLDTVVAGHCVSSCATMFMGGKERAFSDAYKPSMTYIGIHGAHNKFTNAVVNTVQPVLFAFYKQAMADHFNAPVMNMAFYDMDDAGALLVIPESTQEPRRAPYHCKASQMARSSCTEFRDLDALSLGVVTTRDLVHVELPASLRPVTKIFGQDLSVLEDRPAFLAKFGSQHCSSDKCRQWVDDYLDDTYRKEHKAVAMAKNLTGVSTVSNRDTLEQAFLGAIYACNHPHGDPVRLCEALMVDGYDLLDLYVAGEMSHRQALERLTVPPVKDYANEAYGGMFTRATGMRTQQVHDMTPQALDGIRTFNTVELANALKSEQVPVVINVLPAAFESIPGALMMLGGGLAFDHAATDSAYEKRFAGLLNLLSPDLNQPVVFYCLSRNCWLSVNAAMRARKLGYTQVGWYRGGLESWKAANLPMARPVIRAVVH